MPNIKRKNEAKISIFFLNLIATISVTAIEIDTIIYEIIVKISPSWLTE